MARKWRGRRPFSSAFNQCIGSCLREIFPEEETTSLLPIFGRCWPLMLMVKPWQPTFTASSRRIQSGFGNQDVSNTLWARPAKAKMRLSSKRRHCEPRAVRTLPLSFRQLSNASIGSDRLTRKQQRKGEHNYEQQQHPNYL